MIYHLVEPTFNVIVIDDIMYRVIVDCFIVVFNYNIELFHYFYLKRIGNEVSMFWFITKYYFKCLHSMRYIIICTHSDLSIHCISVIITNGIISISLEGSLINIFAGSLRIHEVFGMIKI